MPYKNPEDERINRSKRVVSNLQPLWMADNLIKYNKLQEAA